MKRFWRTWICWDCLKSEHLRPVDWSFVHINLPMMSPVSIGLTVYVHVIDTAVYMSYVEYLRQQSGWPLFYQWLTKRWIGVCGSWIENNKQIELNLEFRVRFSWIMTSDKVCVGRKTRLESCGYRAYAPLPARAFGRSVHDEWFLLSLSLCSYCSWHNGIVVSR